VEPRCAARRFSETLDIAECPIFLSNMIVLPISKLWFFSHIEPDTAGMLSVYRVCLRSPVRCSAPISTRFCKSLVAVARDVLVMVM
jgi:hypothetical protein